MKRQLTLLILLSCCFSCASQKKEVIAKSTIKLEGKNTNIRNFIEIDGYYYMLEYPDSNCRMFFEDGTWVDFSFKRDMLEDGMKVNMPKSVVSRIENKQLRWGSYWGVYKIKEDTLIVYPELRFISKHDYLRRVLGVGATFYSQNTISVSFFGSREEFSAKR